MEEKDEVTLKPCPFCAGEAEYDAELGSVVCTNCEGIGPTAANEEEAIRFWNQRSK